MKNTDQSSTSKRYLTQVKKEETAEKAAKRIMKSVQTNHPNHDKLSEETMNVDDRQIIDAANEVVRTSKNILKQPPDSATTVACVYDIANMRENLLVGMQSKSAKHLLSKITDALNQHDVKEVALLSQSKSAAAKLSPNVDKTKEYSTFTFLWLIIYNRAKNEWGQQGDSLSPALILAAVVIVMIIILAIVMNL